ncbi:MAG: hydantoinase B/oxoprolinase family protein [Candidatus Melainabacteria bacterium]|nr:hydantoinase B/oxoprolinase family protein [Candidatus Melainabacteria bacterium]
MSPGGALVTEKLLSENPRQYADAATAGIRKILGLPADAEIPSSQIDCVKIGTTVATNALLERKGEPTVFVTNKGFGDCLRIAYQNRPDIFARQIILPEQLYSHVIEVDCRCDYQGTELVALDEDAARQQFVTAFDLGFQSCAIVLMHGYRFPSHEQSLRAIAKSVGFTQISTSHETSPLVKLISRGDTSVADAALSPILRRYVDQVQRELKGVRLLFMQSNGGLADALHFRGKDSLLSGPAGGVVGASAVGNACGCANIIAFDMGGTSTDVSHISGAYERTTEAVLAGVRIKTPMIAINTVAAGGGSICSFDGFRMRVGPASAGAVPGPACYGNGGPLTITDCNVLLGRIQPDYFPKVFGPSNDRGLDEGSVKRRFAELAETMLQNVGSSSAPEVVAQGFLTIAVAKMAGAIKQISIEKGHDITDYALVAFGGAGGQHACQIADALGIKKILIHPLAGVLSAYGIGTANVASVKHESIESLLDENSLNLARNVLERLTKSCQQELADQLIGEENLMHTKSLALRYEGTDSSILVPLESIATMKTVFEKTHSDRFGFVSPEKKLVIESVSINVEAKMPAPNIAPALNPTTPTQLPKCKVYLDGSWQEVQLWTSEDLNTDSLIDGPALIAEKMSTTLIEHGWQASVAANGSIVIVRTIELERTNQVDTDLEKPDPAQLELFNHIFMSTAEQMGAALQNTSQSINIKERLDFSCAIFDDHGKLVANAPHIPVHLGSMSACVQQIISNRAGSIKKGDVFVSNNPYAGGTHLPDITVVSPAFIGGDEPAFFLASRGHHADIGGITPGSMPAYSQTLLEEGVVIHNFQLVKEGVFFEEEMRNLLNSPPHPARNIAQNIADLKAQIAANVRGEHALIALCKRYGLPTVHRYMRFVQENAELAVKTAIKLLHDGSFSCEMDSGATIKVSVKIDRNKQEATIDFEGTSTQLKSNMNAPKAITNAAVMYVFRTLIDDDIPLNDGFLVPLTIRIPEECLLNPQFPAAIVAGNVETSQQITDTLYGALGVMAASQGTMNNFTFGNQKYQYYETIAGGSGAGPDFDGTSAVQTNMTNSRLTDPEILEMRFPVILEEFSIRKNSGGAGEHKGGDGVIRRVRFCESMSASILSQRRSVFPHGMQGGANGSKGLNYVIRRDGTRVDLSATATIDLEDGDTFVIETPGGGGFGPP